MGDKRTRKILLYVDAIIIMYEKEKRNRLTTRKSV